MLISFLYFTLNIVMGSRSIIMGSSSLSVIGNTYDYILLADHLTGSLPSGPVTVPGLDSRQHVVVS